jgi:hypothetical protein
MQSNLHGPGRKAAGSPSHRQGLPSFATVYRVFHFYNKRTIPKPLIQEEKPPDTLICALDCVLLCKI